MIGTVGEGAFQTRREAWYLQSELLGWDAIARDKRPRRLLMKAMPVPEIEVLVTGIQTNGTIGRIYRVDELGDQRASRAPLTRQ